MYVEDAKLVRAGSDGGPLGFLMDECFSPAKLLLLHGVSDARHAPGPGVEARPSASKAV